MSNRQTRNMYRSRLNTNIPSEIAKREKDGSDEGSSTSADESGGEAWNSKNDGAVIKQAHYGGKRKRRGRGRGLKKGVVGTDKRRRKRVKSESIDVEPKDDLEDKATQQEEEEMNCTENNKEDEGNQAELEDDVPDQEPETTTRRSGRATKTPDRFDEERYQPFGAPAPPASRANITKALRKLKESRAPSRRGISPDASPDPIASFSDDHDHDMAIDPVEHGPTGDILISTIVPNPPLDGGPSRSRIGRPRKSILKPKNPCGPRQKKAKVIIDESKNQTRTIKIISSTSSDIGRHPSLPTPRTRGPKRFGVRSRRTVPIMGISPLTGKRAVQRYEYVVSSDSTESEDEDMIDPAEFREWIKMKREQEKKNRAFLLTLAARVSDLPIDSSTSFQLPSPRPPPESPIPSTTLIPAPLSSLLPPPEVPIWTKPFSLTPIRPSPPINPDHPSNQEQKRIWDMFVDCMASKWDESHLQELRQVVSYHPPSPEECLTGPAGDNTPVHEDANRPVSLEAQEGMDLGEARQALGMFAGAQTSLPEPIPRPGLDFEKSCDRLAGLEIADRAMGMRLHIPEKRSTKF